MRTDLPFFDSSGTSQVAWPQRDLAWLVCSGLLMCLLVLMVSAKASLAMSSQAAPAQGAMMSIAADHGLAVAGGACRSTQLQGTCTDTEAGDWADLDILPPADMAMHVVRVLRHVETRSPLTQVGVQPRLPPPRSLG